LMLCSTATIDCCETLDSVPAKQSAAVATNNSDLTDLSRSKQAS
jgi:hypothetical protein